MSFIEKLKGLFSKKPKKECGPDCQCHAQQPVVEEPVEEAPKKASNTAPWQELDRKVSGKK